MIAMKNLKYLFIICLFLVVVSCSSDDDGPNNTRVTNFLNNLVDQMQANSMNRKTIDWDNFRTQVLNAAADAQTFDETDEAVTLALRLLGENSSFIEKEDRTFLAAIPVICSLSNISPVTSVPDGIGYVRVNGFRGTTAEAVAFAENMHEDIRSQDNQNINGWIVDLRDNLGGNMFAMIAGIGPILGEGTAGFFIDADDNMQAWSYEDGASRLDQGRVIVVPNPYELINPNAKVAVLINNGVASGAEAVAISFIGRDNTRSFGSGTCGIAADNARFSLLDGSTLFLAVESMADRNKVLYGSIPITPDTPTTDENVLQTAIDYINN